MSMSIPPTSDKTSNNSTYIETTMYYMTVYNTGNCCFFLHVKDCLIVWFGSDFLILGLIFWFGSDLGLISQTPLAVSSGTPYLTPLGNLYIYQAKYSCLDIFFPRMVPICVSLIYIIVSLPLTQFVFTCAIPTDS